MYWAILGFIISLIGFLLVQLWTERNYVIVPSNVYRLIPVQATVSSAETTAVVYRNMGYSLTSITQDVLKRREITMWFEKGR